MDFSLSGKVAIITGGSRGIGEAVALCYAQAGADVAIVGRHIEDLDIVAEKIREHGVRALPVRAHIGKMETIQPLVDRVKDELGRIDILVNNAASNPTMAAAIDVDERSWDSIMNLNLKGLYFLSQAVARVMRDQGDGGRIINVTSAGGIRPHILPIYSISKGALVMATKVMALEWAKYGICVNAVAPGLTQTKFSQALWDDKDILKYLLERVPLDRFAQPDEIAGIMLYLASDAASFVTGTTIPIDGGETI
jgi:dehydrogenase/reductase SDR family member 4